MVSNELLTNLSWLAICSAHFCAYLDNCLHSLNVTNLLPNNVVFLLRYLLCNTHSLFTPAMIHLQFSLAITSDTILVGRVGQSPTPLHRLPHTDHTTISIYTCQVLLLFRYLYVCTYNGGDRGPPRTPPEGGGGSD